jgi:hypothetical protein
MEGNQKLSVDVVLHGCRYVALYDAMGDLIESTMESGNAQLVGQ